MDPEILYNFIQEQGYRTLEEITVKFDLQKEILEAHLAFLGEHKKINHINYQKPDHSKGILYFNM